MATTPTTPTANLRRFALEHPAAMGGTVQQGHADYCAAYGHAEWREDGVLQSRCSRCGDTTATTPPTAIELALNQLAQARSSEAFAPGHWGHLVRKAEHHLRKCTADKGDRQLAANVLQAAGVDPTAPCSDCGQVAHFGRHTGVLR